MERLKGIIATPVMRTSSVFTFQYGEIKRAKGRTNLSIVSVFTFQYGEIKRRASGIFNAINEKFTFQYGEIKSSGACNTRT